MRTLSEQSALYLRGRTPESKAKGEKIVTYAKPGHSPHNWGCATDWVEYRPEWKQNDVWVRSGWAFYGKCAQKAGLQWGGLWKKFPDKPHNELPIECTWTDVFDEFNKNKNVDINIFIADKIKGKK
jgi:peptidoglycan L-alanyl-D-glutamate endopeptidase CwlK